MKSRLLLSVSTAALLALAAPGHAQTYDQTLDQVANSYGMNRSDLSSATQTLVRQTMDAATAYNQAGNAADDANKKVNDLTTSVSQLNARANQDTAAIQDANTKLNQALAQQKADQQRFSNAGALQQALTDAIAKQKTADYWANKATQSFNDTANLPPTDPRRKQAVDGYNNAITLQGQAHAAAEKAADEVKSHGLATLQADTAAVNAARAAATQAVQTSTQSRNAASTAAANLASARTAQTAAQAAKDKAFTTNAAALTNMLAAAKKDEDAKLARQVTAPPATNRINPGAAPGLANQAHAPALATPGPIAAPVISSNNAGIINTDNASLAATKKAPIVSNDGGSVISHDGGTIINQNNAGLINHDGASVVGHNASAVVGPGGASVVGPGGASVVSDAGSALISNRPANAGLINQDGAGLISNKTTGLLSDNGIGLISNKAASIVTDQGAGFAHVMAAGLAAPTNPSAIFKQDSVITANANITFPADQLKTALDRLSKDEQATIRTTSAATGPLSPADEVKVKAIWAKVANQMDPGTVAQFTKQADTFAAADAAHRANQNAVAAVVVQHTLQNANDPAVAAAANKIAAQQPLTPDEVKRVNTAVNTAVAALPVDQKQKQTLTQGTTAHVANLATPTLADTQRQALALMQRNLEEAQRKGDKVSVAALNQSIQALQKMMQPPPPPTVRAAVQPSVPATSAPTPPAAVAHAPAAAPATNTPTQANLKTSAPPKPPEQKAAAPEKHAPRTATLEHHAPKMGIPEEHMRRGLIREPHGHANEHPHTNVTAHGNHPHPLDRHANVRTPTHPVNRPAPKAPTLAAAPPKPKLPQVGAPPPTRH